jgi:hypothetical protein
MLEKFSLSNNSHNNNLLDNTNSIFLNGNSQDLNKLNEIILELVDLATNEVEEPPPPPPPTVELRREQSQINWFLNTTSGENEEAFFNFDLFDDVQLLDNDPIVF